jgi:hypothetical protein
LNISGSGSVINIIWFFIIENYVEYSSSSTINFNINLFKVLIRINFDSFNFSHSRITCYLHRNLNCHMEILSTRSLLIIDFHIIIFISIKTNTIWLLSSNRSFVPSSRIILFISITSLIENFDKIRSISTIGSVR